MQIRNFLAAIVAASTVSCANDAAKPSTEPHVDVIYRGSITQYGSRGLKESSYQRHGMVVDPTSNWKGGLSKGLDDRPIDTTSEIETSHTASYAVAPETPVSTSGTAPQSPSSAQSNPQQQSTYTATAKSFEANRIDKGKCSYVVQKGDTLWSISGEKLGDNLQWHQIYSDNEIAIGGNPDLIYPDQQYWIDRCN